MTDADGAQLGAPFDCVERSAVDTLRSLGPYLIAVNDPPWSSIVDQVPAPVTIVTAHDMEVAKLDRDVEHTAEDGAEVVVGFGGGTALDTAKYLAWKRELPLLQIPTITSVDAGFTDAIGVRSEGRVRYVGTIVPEEVVLDIDLVRSAPPRLNRAGIGDVLSCHTGLHDWRAAVDAGEGVGWNEAAAELGEALLAELDSMVVDVHDVTPDGIRWLADGYGRIGAACAALGHSRFEEGSEHFWAYAYEHATGVHHVHGELISFAVVAMAHVQENDPEFVHHVVSYVGVRAHPDDLGISRVEFVENLVGLRAYSRAEGLDVGVADLTDIDVDTANHAFDFASTLPRA
ncbi:MAG TPA: iron-containing alcohol dehydrogenase [Ilumatobacteraceae bacterium]|nr:iron-containing alcohol dehydrogenase [Ilumatobacteraceae bacterium]